MRKLIYPCVLVVIGLSSDLALADAFVVTRAMKASTIAEIFIVDDEIRVELEVGAADLAVFANVLPDRLFERMTGRAEPLEQRQSRFLEQDWVITADDRALDGAIQRVQPMKRVVRDEITGDPLANQPADAEVVVAVEIRYPLSGQPKSVSIQPPSSDNNATMANIGFVVHHQGIAVNDFRYLSTSESVFLDWKDPWYSEFERSTLRRKNYAPAAAFVYVEDLEVRKEIVIRPRDLQTWVDLGLEGQSTITSDQRDVVRETAAAFLAENTPLTIDGIPSEGTLDRIHFINRSLRTTGVVPEGQSINVDSALLGAIYVYQIESLPNQVSMQWKLFDQRITQIPCVATDQAGGLPGMLSETDPTLVWKNFLKNPTKAAFLTVLPPAPQRTLAIPVVALIACVIAGFIWKRSRATSLGLICLGMATMIWSRAWIDLPIERRTQVTPDDASQVTHSLLHNIYRAFDYRDESAIYDVLARSATGDLLTQVFLETRRSLTLANQGGARVKVKQVEMVDCVSQTDTSDAFTAQCTWNVTGNVGHWGHLHERRNQYVGQLRVRSVDGQWKISELDLLSEERL